MARADGGLRGRSGADRHSGAAARAFAEARKVARVEHPYSMPYQHFDVFYCRGLKPSMNELWPRVKRWD